MRSGLYTELGTPLRDLRYIATQPYPRPQWRRWMTEEEYDAMQHQQYRPSGLPWGGGSLCLGYSGRFRVREHTRYSRWRDRLWDASQGIVRGEPNV